MGGMGELLIKTAIGLEPAVQALYTVVLPSFLPAASLTCCHFSEGFRISNKGFKNLQFKYLDFGYFT